MSTVFHNILRAVASAMEIPVVICLLLALAFAAFSVGRWLTRSWPGSRSRAASPAAERIWKSGARYITMPRPAPITSSGTAEAAGAADDRGG